MEGVDLVVSPYDAGRHRWRMGAGPEVLAARSDLVPATAAPVRVTTLQADPDDVPSELRRGFGLQRAVAQAGDAAVRAGRFPVLLAGDCNTALGLVAAHQLRDRTPAFLWLDAHADFHTPETDRFGSLDSQGLAMLTGRAWRGMARDLGLRPLADAHVALVGARAIDPAELDSLSRSAVRRIGVAEAAGGGVGRHVRTALDSGADTLHLHVDADVLDPSIAPANDYAAPGGLTEEGIHAVLDSLPSPPDSLSVASYDPRLDPEGRLAAVLAGVMRRVVAMATGPGGAGSDPQAWSDIGP